MLGHMHFQVDDIDPVDHDPSTKNVICWCVRKQIKNNRAVRLGTVDLDSDEENGSSSSGINITLNKKVDSAKSEPSVTLTQQADSEDSELRVTMNQPEPAESLRQEEAGPKK